MSKESATHGVFKGLADLWTHDSIGATAFCETLGLDFGDHGIMLKVT